jgi:hypothetical protein
VLSVGKYDRDIDAAVIEHGKDVLCRALQKVSEGAVRLHVKQNGRELYDLSYIRNNDILPAWTNNSGIRFLEAPDFWSYDMTDPGKLYLALFDGFHSVFFEEVNEYTIGIAQVLLHFTNLKVCFMDERALLFLDPHERLEVLQSSKRNSAAVKQDTNEDKNAVPVDPGQMRVMAAYQKNILDMDFHAVDAVSLFYNVFAWQSFTDLPFDKVKYIRLEMAYDEGIGSLLSNYTKCVNAFQPLGWETVLKKGASRYKDQLLNRYFNLKFEGEDSDPSCMAVIDHFYSVAFLHFFRTAEGGFDASILRRSFLEEMDQYRDAVFAKRRMLGVLIRGTDYVINSMPANLRQADVEMMIPMIREWMQKYGYERIFLATEDKDILNRVRTAFPGKVLAVAQERYSISDFHGARFISELDQKEQEDADEVLEDTTVNYFYALYLLSCCDGFLCSGNCNGDNVVKSLNQNKFQHYYKFDFCKSE